MKKTLMILVALLLCLLTFPALADGDVPPASQIAPGNRSFVEWRNGMKSSDFCLTYLSAGITPGDGYVIIASSTEANVEADTLSATLTIQQWANNQWNRYFSCSIYGDATYSLDYTRHVNVTPGYYYRLRVYHCGAYAAQFADGLTTTKSVYVE